MFANNQYPSNQNITQIQKLILILERKGRSKANLGITEIYLNKLAKIANLKNLKK